MPLTFHPEIKTPMEIKPIGSTNYVILPCGTVARKLKPIIKNGIPVWNLGTGKAGQTKRIDLNKPEALAAYLSLTEKIQKQA
jgi:hypothetical protein